MHYGLSIAATICALAIACAPAIKRTSPTRAPAQPSQLWTDPGDRRSNLFEGPSVDDARPRPDQRYTVTKHDTRGFSATFRVRDEPGREWNVKIGPEARTEVVSSRIVWALGYHALPSYFVERWIAVDEHAKGAVLGGARFRPHDLGMKSLGEWSWQQNPYVGTREYNGLLALMMILNSTDLKNTNNELFEVEQPRRGEPDRWYVVKDLGASLGETGRIDPRRGDINSFERGPFIRGVRNGRVRFNFHGRHQELLEGIAPDDVRWLAQRFDRLSDRQLRDAFHAGHFSPEETTRYVARLRAKVAEGLALQ
jgi:hypothetical protein